MGHHASWTSIQRDVFAGSIAHAMSSVLFPGVVSLTKKLAVPDATRGWLSYEIVLY